MATAAHFTRSRSGRLAAVIVLFMLLPSCAPKYLIKGLTLPPGSTVVNTTELDSRPSFLSNPTAGESRYLSITFDDPTGWIAVIAHFESFLLSAGYTKNASSKISDQTDGEYDVESDPAKMLDGMSDSMCTYTNYTTGTMVAIVDYSSFSNAAGKESTPGQFGLNIHVLK